MPILIQEAPTAIKQDQSHKTNLLQRNDLLTTTNLGGKFALPAEFDTTKLASGFYAEGQEARAMQGRQPIVGSPYTADGWQVWKYPDEIESGKTDAKGRPIMVEHPQAGEVHKVAGAKRGENYVLMCRPLEIQNQVNHVYGLVSIAQMTQEIRGETLADDAGGRDSGMLPDTRLKKEIGAEQEIEELQGRSTAVHAGTLDPGSAVEAIRKKPKKVSR